MNQLTVIKFTKMKSNSQKSSQISVDWGILIYLSSRWNKSWYASLRFQESIHGSSSKIKVKKGWKLKR